MVIHIVQAKNFRRRLEIQYLSIKQNDMTMPSPSWSASVKDLLSRMTIKEKIGQMTQLTVDMLCEGEPYKITKPFRLDPQKMEKAIIDYGVGSILNVPPRNYPTSEQWHRLIDAIQNMAQASRLKIPVLYGLDHIHGVNYIQGGTLFPQPLSIACTWNPDRAIQIAEITAYESRAVGVPWTFSPALDIGRMPVWPRFWESFGEDVMMNAVMGQAMVVGYQGDDPGADDKIGACLKHFTGYSMPLSGKDRTPAWIPERFLREYFIPQYQAAIDAGALTIMVNSGEINGIPTHADFRLLIEVLRGEMGFTGLLVTDWQDIHYLYDRHKTASSLKEAVYQSILAGIDMSMTPTTFQFADLLLELVDEGRITEERIDLSVGRILSTKEKMGLFKFTQLPLAEYPDFGCDAHQQISLDTAIESVVLLKNEAEVLPLSREITVLITGPMANTLEGLNGGWTVNWQGDDVDQYLSHYETIAEAVVNEMNEEQVYLYEGDDIQSAKEAASMVDCILLCLGERSYCEFEGNIDDLRLPDRQIELAHAMIATGKPVILVIAAGRPRIINEIESKIPAILGAFYPGPMGSVAIGKILFGDENPSAKLPFTYPRYSNDLVPYDHKQSESIKVMTNQPVINPQFSFGHGLSYTTFLYDNLLLDKEQIAMDENILISVDVTNQGDRPGLEVVQLYIRDEVASISPPVKRLRGFEKVDLDPGETKKIEFEINPNQLAFVGLGNQWIIEPGEFTVMIQNLSRNFWIKPTS